jgi:hypothetical protein
MRSVMFALTIRKITWGVFLVLLFLVVSLPTGSIMGVNVKFIVFGMFACSFLLYALTSRNIFAQSDVLLLTAVLTALSFWSLIGILNGESETKQIFYQLRDLASAILIAWLCIFAVRRRLIRAERLILVIVAGMFAVATLKVALVASSFFLDISPVQAIEYVFGEGSTVGGAIEFNLVRLSFSADILGAVAIFAVLAPSVSGVKLGRAAKFAVCLTIVLGCGFLAYSRYLWFFYIASVFLALIVERSWKTMAAILVSAVILCIPLYDAVSTIITARFLSEGTEISDSGRVEQANALLDEIEIRPVLGKGVGAHTNAHISNGIYLYGYEMQWLAFLMQFGVLGELGILLLVALSTRDLLKAKHRAKVWILLLFALWLLASWTNPYLTSSFAGAVFGLFMAMFYRMRHTDEISFVPDLAMQTI